MNHVAAAPFSSNFISCSTRTNMEDQLVQTQEEMDKEIMLACPRTPRDSESLSQSSHSVNLRCKLQSRSSSRSRSRTCCSRSRSRTSCSRSRSQDSRSRSPSDRRSKSPVNYKSSDGWYIPVPPVARATAIEIGKHNARCKRLLGGNADEYIQRLETQRSLMDISANITKTMIEVEDRLVTHARFILNLKRPELALDLRHRPYLYGTHYLFLFFIMNVYCIQNSRKRASAFEQVSDGWKATAWVSLQPMQMLLCHIKYCVKTAKT